MADHETTLLTEAEKAISLFEFIKELNKLKQKPVLDMGEYPWCRTLSQLPPDPDHVQVFYRDRVEDETPDSENGGILLEVRKPVLENCPEPGEDFADWLLPGWDNFRNAAAVQSFATVGKDTEFFSDDAARAAAFRTWEEARTAWAQRQKLLTQSKQLFSDLYRL